MYRVSQSDILHRCQLPTTETIMSWWPPAFSADSLNMCCILTTTTATTSSRPTVLAATVRQESKVCVGAQFYNLCTLTITSNTLKLGRRCCFLSPPTISIIAENRAQSTRLAFSVFDPPLYSWCKRHYTLYPGSLDLSQDKSHVYHIVNMQSV